MGWIPAMRSLHTMLIGDPLSRRDVKIGELQTQIDNPLSCLSADSDCVVHTATVRFEFFQSPLSVCRKLFAFALDSPGSPLAQKALLQGSIDQVLRVPRVSDSVTFTFLCPPAVLFIDMRPALQQQRCGVDS
jgi:hypothetical protein